MDFRGLCVRWAFKQIKKDLELDDVENGDLIHVDDETGEISGGQKLIAFWNWDRKNYYVR